MAAKLLGFFSGFPTHHFTDRITDVLEAELHVRNSIVFISGYPDNYCLLYTSRFPVLQPRQGCACRRMHQRAGGTHHGIRLFPLRAHQLHHLLQRTVLGTVMQKRSLGCLLHIHTKPLRHARGGILNADTVQQPGSVQRARRCV